MRVTITDLKEMKRKAEKIPMITAYDYTSARLVESTGIPLILVGDSLGQVVQGHDSTLPVTMDDIIYHVKSVVRGTQKAHVIADMPFMSYQADVADAIRNAGRLLKEGGASSVKLEGGRVMAETVRRIVEVGIPVMGHIGLTPQSFNQLGGYKVQGKTAKAALDLMDDALALEQAGVYAIVLEMVPLNLAQSITRKLSIPTIGIGAGVHCDGQVQVFHDILGLITDEMHKHARRYAEVGNLIKAVMEQYIQDVRNGAFPTDRESFHMAHHAIEEMNALGSPVDGLVEGAGYRNRIEGRK
ncbi:MAG: 3-methyl-2-oxobutanoate hydroxymethyltransferase [SAR202 cluster bacterium]|nr:3-methyl-2-oxobutanoate hydroxymethyltransferase [SAR202 cluster bacterium]